MTETRPTKGKIFADLLLGLVVIGLLLFAKLYVEDTYVGHWLTARGYEFLHRRIPPFEAEHDLPVVVVDISDMNRGSDGITPTKTLREIVEALAANKAKAVAIDIDFSPRVDPQNPANTGFRSEEDPEFFEFLHAQKKSGMPVFVGAYNAGVDPTSWLGLGEYNDLAVDMKVFDEDTTQVPMWLKCDGGGRLNSISKALADASGAKPEPSHFLEWLLVNPEDDENLKTTYKKDKGGNQVTCKSAFTFVNYSKLELIQRVTLPAPNSASINTFNNEEGKSRFEGKLVIIGNTQRGKASDYFVVPGRSKPVSGSYIHASATYSLVDEPVYKFKHWATIFLDILLGLVIVFGVFCVRWRHRGDTQFPSHTWENRFIIASIAISLLLGFVFVRFFHVLWLDFSLVVFALFLHSRVQEWLRRIPRIFSGAKGPSPAGTE